MSGALDPFEIAASDTNAGQRLDRFLADARPDISRSTFQRWIDEARITIDGRVGARKDKIKAGMTVRVTPAPPPPSSAIPEDIPITVLYEDEDLLVVDKPPGLVVHPAPGHSGGTLVNAVLHRYGAELEDTDPSRPGIVHRLDRDTSGVMVVARTTRARDHLGELFASHRIERNYLAIAVGNPPTQVSFETLYGRHPRDRKKWSGKVVRGKRAVTHVTRIAPLRGAALVRCRLETGRTHQIRVHLSEAGFPLLGDPMYGSTPRDPLIRRIGDALGRQALHAAVLGFPHPRSGAMLRFTTDPPSDFQDALRALALT